MEEGDRKWKGIGREVSIWSEKKRCLLKKIMKIEEGKERKSEVFKRMRGWRERRFKKMYEMKERYLR